ncbi:MAG TPA: fatty acid desaturase [Rhizomicrobium sp.]|nr:fatty acid desaturase [Rhizomicrobium sp.]
MSSPNFRPAINTALLCIALAVAALQFVVFPLFAPLNAASETALIAVLALTAPLHWGLMHESIHGKLFENDAANRAAGRLLGISICLDWDIMRFGHLMHHRANRHDRDRPEDVAPGRSRLAAAPGYFFTLLGGGTIQGALAPLAVVLPLRGTERVVQHLFGGVEALRDPALRAFSDPERRLRIRSDFAATLALVALGIWCWGAHWPLLVLAVAARFCVLSLLDNAPHYGTPRDSGTRAYNTLLARPLRWLVLNANFHGVHHQAPQLAWQELPRTFDRSGQSYSGSWIACVLRQFRGPMRLG